MSNWGLDLSPLKPPFRRVGETYESFRLLQSRNRVFPKLKDMKMRSTKSNLVKLSRSLGTHSEYDSGTPFVFILYGGPERSNDRVTLSFCIQGLDLSFFSVTLNLGS